MNALKLYLSIFLLTILAFSCRKESITTEVETTIPEPTIFIESSIYGVVSADDGTPIEAADVTWGTSSTLTDENGYFKLKSTVSEKNAVLNVKKDNYFEAHQALAVPSQGSIRTNVELIERLLTATLSAANGGSIDVSGGGQVDFAANGFKDATGNPYSGEVNVYTTYLDPTRVDLRAVMPGNLTAINSTEELQLLQSFGMINVELESNTGTPLQLTQAATLTTPVPSSLVGIAPATIPLWHFDTGSGLWVEEGEAVLEGNQYVGQVEHFTWWNCDIPQDFITLSGTVSAGNSSPVVDIRITQISNGTMGTLTTSTRGFFIGEVPKDETLLLEILDHCGTTIYSEQVGPFSVDTNLPGISINLDQIELITLSGTAENCDQLPIDNGYVSIIGANISAIFPIDNGSFTYDFIDCGATELTIRAIDIDEYTESEPIILPVQTEMTTGLINTCEQTVTASFSMTLDGVTEIFTPCTAQGPQPVPGIPNLEQFKIFFQIPIPGGGSNNYEMNIFDWFPNNPDPQYALNYEITRMDDPNFDYTFQVVTDETIITKLSENEEPGDILHFLIENVAISKEYINGSADNFPASTIEIKALIQ